MTVILVNAEAGRIPLPDGTVHCSVSSPPYYSLRKYEGDQARDWPEVFYHPQPGAHMEYIPPMTCALGHESTPEAFIAHLVACYREVWRVSRADSAHWLVIGDSYAAAGYSRQHNTGGAKREQGGKQKHTVTPNGLQPGDLMLIPHRLALALQADGWLVRNDCVFAKVAPMPESVAGWSWQRHRIKTGREPADWKKLPKGWDVGVGSHDSGITKGNYRKEGEREATTPTWADCPGCPRCDPHDGYVLRRGSWRHTRAHEFTLHLSKGMGYWSDGEAVREPSIGQTGLAASFRRETKDHLIPGQAAIQHRMDREDISDNGGRNPRSVLSHDDPMRDLFRFIPREVLVDFLRYWADEFNQASENPVSILTPAGEGGYSGAHYATYPKNLIRPLIKSSCPTKCCPECGSGWAPVIEREAGIVPNEVRGYQAGVNSTSPNITHGQGSTHAVMFPNSMQLAPRGGVETNILGYRPTCTCHAGNPDPPHIPGLVLDSFFGSGTTGIVARELGLDCIGLDLSYDYLHDQARERLGLIALHEWEHGRDGWQSKSLEELPLFAEVTS